MGTVLLFFVVALFCFATNIVYVVVVTVFAIVCNGVLLDIFAVYRNYCYRYCRSFHYFICCSGNYCYRCLVAIVVVIITVVVVLNILLHLSRF